MQLSPFLRAAPRKNVYGNGNGNGNDNDNDNDKVAWRRFCRGGRLTKWKGRAASCAPGLFCIPVRAPEVAAVVALATLASSASAEDRYWDVNGTAPGYGGTGTWSTGTGNLAWSPNDDGVSGPYTFWDNAAGDTAILGGTSGTITLGNDIAAEGLSFQTSGYVVTDGTLTLVGSSTVDVATGQGEIQSVLAGNNGLSKSGDGTLFLNGANTLSGSINIGAGSLLVNNDAALGDAGNGVAMAGGTTLQSIDNLSASRNVTLGDGLVTIQDGAGSAMFSGAGDLRARQTSLTNDANDFTGQVFFVGGGSFTSIGDLGVQSALGAANTIANGTVVVSAAGGSAGVASYIGGGASSNRNWELRPGGQGAGILRNNGSGTLSLSGDIAGTGTGTALMRFQANSGDLDLSGVISSSNDRSVYFEGTDTDRTIILSGVNTFSGGVAIRDVTVEADKLSNTGQNSALGTGADGDLSITNGNLVYTGSGDSSDRAVALSGTVGLSNAGSGGLDLAGDMTFTGGGNQLTLGGSYAGMNMLSGSIEGTGDLVMDGAAGSTWILQASNNFTGATTIEGGTLRLEHAEALGLRSQDLTVNGGTLNLSGVSTTVSALSGAGGSISLSGVSALTVDSDSSTTFAGDFNGSGDLVKTGTGTLTLTGESTTTGDTVVNGGNLALDFADAAAPQNDIASSASTLVMRGGGLQVSGADGETNNQRFADTQIAAGSNRIQVSSGTGGAANLDLGNIIHSGGLIDFALPSTGSILTSTTALGGWATVNGTDYAQVSGGEIVARTVYANKDDAGTWVDGDVVSDEGGVPGTEYFGTVSTDTDLGGLKYTVANTSTVTIDNSATLGVDGTIIVADTTGTTHHWITGGSLTGPAGGGSLGVLHNGAGNFVIQSDITDNSGAVGFTKAGTGEVRLTGDNTYTGATVLSGGTLRIQYVADAGQASSIGAASADATNLVLESGKLIYDGSDSSSDRGFTLVNGGAERTIQVNGSTQLEFSGLVTGAEDASLTKYGSGTLALTNAANDYTGQTLITSGTLSVGTLADGGQASGIGASSSDASNLQLQSGGMLQYTGATTSSDRGFLLSQGNGGFDVSDAATNLTLSGVGTGPGTLIKEGAGTLTLAGKNQYSTGTQINAGTLRAGTSEVFGTAGSFLGYMEIGAAGTLDLNGFDNEVGGLRGAGTVQLAGAELKTTRGGTFTGAITGDGALTIDSWAQTLNGCASDYTGVTTVRSNLSVDCIADGGESSSIGASSNASSNLVLDGGRLTYTGADATTDRGMTLTGGAGTVDVAQADTDLEFSGAIVGTNGLIKEGAGTLVLSGNNTFSGNTLIYNGTLRAESESALGSGTARISNLATLDLNGYDSTVAGFEGAGDIHLGDATLTTNSIWWNTFSGTISGTGGITKEHGGFRGQALSGCDNSYTGVTRMQSNGRIRVDCLADGGQNSGIGASSSDAANLILDNGLLEYNGNGGTTDRLFTLGSGGGVLLANGTGPITFTNTGAMEFIGTSASRMLTLAGTSSDDNSLAAQINDAVGGVTSFTKSGASTWILRNSNSLYSGVTTISGGVLGVDKLSNGGQASSIGASSNDASNLLIGNNSVLRYTGAGDSTDRLFTLSEGTTSIESSGTGAIHFTNTDPISYSGSGSRTVGLGGTSNGMNTLGGQITDGPGGATTLGKSGSGTWVLTGSNTYTGNTVINDGNLVVGDGGTTGNAGAGNVIVNAPSSILSFNRGDAFSFEGAISGPGTIAQIGQGTTLLTAVSNNIGAARVEAGTLQVENELLTASVDMQGDSALVINGTVGAPGGDATVLTGDMGGSTVTINPGGVLHASVGLGGGNDLLDVQGRMEIAIGSTATLGAGDDVLRIADGAVLDNGAAALGFSGGDGSDLLDISNSGAMSLSETDFADFEALSKDLSGTMTLLGAHDYVDGVTVRAGVLQVGDDAQWASLAGDVMNDGELVFSQAADTSLAGDVSGIGAVMQFGSGKLILNGTNSYDGVTNVASGSLFVMGDQSDATGATTVANGALLGGSGTIGGDVAVLSGATLAPGADAANTGTLKINGDLELASGTMLAFNFGQAGVVGGAFNDHVVIGGDLTLDGNLDVTETPGGTFGPGIYRLLSYGETLTDNGLNVASPDYSVQTSVANQVNLVSSDGLALSYWDGDVGPHANEQIDGGDGTWLAATGRNWTDETGLYSAGFDNGSFAIFAGNAGTVTVDNTGGAVMIAGMQVATDGYRFEGDEISLNSAANIRVGDGSAAGADYSATIAANLAGMGELVKTDLGTLVLDGANTYTGGTTINGGTVQISRDENLGAGGTGVEVEDATLRNTGAISTARGMVLKGTEATFDAQADLFLTGTVSGVATLRKRGAGTLTLSSTNSYSGGTEIGDGVVSVAQDANLGAAGTSVSLDGSTLRATGAFSSGRVVSLGAGGGTLDTQADLFLTSALEGAGALTKTGTGDLTLLADSAHIGGTAIQGGRLQLGAGGTGGMVSGDVLNDGVLAFNRSDDLVFAGLVSGAGALEQSGAGAVVLTADNDYGGATDVLGGQLFVNGDQSSATGTTTVFGGATLGGMGTTGGDVLVDSGGSLAPGGMSDQPGTLHIGGDLRLDPLASLSYSFGQAGVVGGAYNDHTVVAGDLVLDGDIQVVRSSGGDFGPGIYRVVSYDGALTDNGLTTSSPDHHVQSSIASQINLVSTGGLQLRYWDGSVVPERDNSAIDGGDGVWRLVGDPNWSESTGDLNGQYYNGSFAVFAGRAGDVETNDDSGEIHAAGLQFATDGYTIRGDGLTLDGTEAVIRVGDGTLEGAEFTATLNAGLGGDATLVKTDLGSLILGGNNSYSGGTTINGGTLSVSSDANLGASDGGVLLNGATLRTTANMETRRTTTLAGLGGTITVEANLHHAGMISGDGDLVKAGAGTLFLSADNSYGGATNVSDGTLIINGDQTTVTGETLIQNGATIGGVGTIGGDLALLGGATLAPGAAMGEAGTLTVEGDLTMAQGARLTYDLGAANTVGGSLNDLTHVKGDLTLDGTIDVTETDGGVFGPGIYRLFNYAGGLTNNGLTLGALPASDVRVQTAIDNQVNLVVSDGIAFNFWDGSTPGFDGSIGGGSGVWHMAPGEESWTDSDGALNAGFSNGAFAVFGGEKGVVSVSNDYGQVEVAGMQFLTDGYVIDGDSLSLAGMSPAVIRVGDATEDGANITATIAAVLKGSIGLVKSDLGTLILTGNNTYSGDTAINNGILSISSDENLGAADGSLSLEGGTLKTTSSFATDRQLVVASNGGILTDGETSLDWGGVFTGSGELSKLGDGTLKISGANNDFSGTFGITGGTVNVATNLCGTTVVESGGRLGGNGTVCELHNEEGGIVAPGESIGTLTVTGDYEGSGGTLEIEAELGEDGSPADRLIVGGDTSGMTKVHVITLDDTGAQTDDGINIVEVGGKSEGTFELLGDYVFEGQPAVVGGAYAYRLYKGGVSSPTDGNWYLRSALLDGADSGRPLYQPGVPIYESYAATLQQFNRFNTLQQRVGNRMWGAPQVGTSDATPLDGDGMWVRIEATQSDLDPKASTSQAVGDIDTWKIQAGVDGVVGKYEAGQFVGGVFAQYGTISSSIASPYGYGSIDSTVYGLGTTLTWYGDNGFYADGQAQLTWSDSDLRSSTAGIELAEGNGGDSYGLSIEAGQRIEVSENWSLTPQLQLTYNSVRFDDFEDKFGADVSLDSSESLTSRIGVAANYDVKWQGENGSTNRVNVYGISDLLYESDGTSDIKVSDVTFSQASDSLHGSIGMGGAISWDDDKYSIYGEARVNTSMENFGDSNMISGTFGVRMRW
ncbi:autotransporter-associated beta strand repeat-containing protein [Vreelandella sp. H-I2]